MAGLKVGTVGGGPTVRVARPGLGTGAVSLGGGDLSALPAMLSKLRADENSLQIQATMVTRFSRFARRAVYNCQNEVRFRRDSRICKMRGDRFHHRHKAEAEQGLTSAPSIQIGSIVTYKKFDQTRRAPCNCAIFRFAADRVFSCVIPTGVRGVEGPRLPEARQWYPPSVRNRRIQFLVSPP
jgi:hypothetical protein